LQADEIVTTVIRAAGRGKGGDMAIQLRQTPATPAQTGRSKLRAVPIPVAPPRRAELVHVRRAVGEDARWECHCLCGWTSRRLQLRDEAHASDAARQHLRVCTLLSH
jgi:hypothetical protein